MRLVAPSMLSGDFLQLGKDVDFVNESGDIFHLDVMDGEFVPNISFGFPVVEAIAKRARRPLDVHLMITHPEKYIDRFAKAGAHMISFHLEAAQDAGLNAETLLKRISSLGVSAGLAIDPDVPVEKLFPYVNVADYLLIMSVFAGFGGQTFIKESVKRIAALKAEILQCGAQCLIEVDGGIGPANADAVAAAGADILVAGSSIFKATDRTAALRAIKGPQIT